MSGTAVASAPAVPAERAPTPARRGAALPAVSLLVLYLALLLLIPSELVLAEVGSAGTPANLLGLAFLLWWVCARLGGQVSARLTPMHLALGVLVLCVLLALVNGLAHGWTRPVDIRQDFDEVWTLLPVTETELFDKSVLGAMRGLIALGSWVGVALLIIDGIRSWPDLDRVIDVLVGLCAVVAALGIYQYFTGDNLARHVQVPGLSPTYDVGVSISRSVLNRVSATTTHPIEFCVVLTTVLPLALHRAFHPRRTGTVRRVLTVYLPAALIALAIPMAVSRSGIVALGTAMLVLFVGWPANRRLWLLVLAPPAAVLMRSALPGLLGTIRSLFTQSLTDPSVTARTDDYGTTLALYSEHALLGRGAFTFIPQYYRVLDNQLLLNLIELGILGLTATLGVFATGYYLARHAKRHADSEEHRHLGLALSAAIAAMFIAYFTFDAWGFAKTGAVTFVLLGLAGALYRLEHTARAPEPASTDR
ncbi:O-antigen ligase family protein [Nocardioides campestrisoli]|uniref:O-antigen ligase family protein n=1 Tax=Nocardioides campestrisoli TaxID=2736757 RepID=UPI0015E65B31|nr:O-antigen ligase family protein [Nocardioides campestrisoli]